MPDVCVLLIEGTNCEEETRRAFESVGLEAELVHLKQLTGDCNKEMRKNLFDYRVLMLPGGWSAGDYVRAGAIFAARIKSRLGGDIKEFVESGNLVGGICNGFQILTEMGLLPAFDGMGEAPVACLTNNLCSSFQCRPTYIRHVNSCRFTGEIGRDCVMQIPVAHAEGRFTFGERDRELLSELVDNKQIVFRYCRENGDEAGGMFPWNPNGSLYDIAGICNPEGNVLGLMPHPERVIDVIQESDWTRKTGREYSDGRLLFESVAKYLKKR